MKLVTRILLFFVALVVLLSILRTYSTIRLIEQTTLDQTEKRLIANLSLVTFAVDRELDHMENHFAVTVHDVPFCRDVSAGRLDTVEKKLLSLAHHSETDAAFLSDKHGNIVLSVYAQNVITLGETAPILSGLRKGLTSVTVNGKALPALFVTLPLPRGEKESVYTLIGIAVLTPSSPFLKSIDRALARNPLDPFFGSIFNDRAQLFTFRAGNVSAFHDDLTADEARAVYDKGKTYTGKKVIDGVGYIVMYQPVRPGGLPLRWAYGIAINESLLLAARNRALYMFILISVFGTVAVILLSYLVTRGINPSLGRIVNACRHIQDGDIKGTIDIDGIHIKEFRIIASAVNTMATSIAEREQTITKNLNNIRIINAALEEKTRLARLERQKLTTILETIRDALVTIDARGVVTYFNRAAELMWGIDRHGVVGRHYGKFFSNFIVENHESNPSREIQITSPSGIMPLTVTVFPLISESQDSGYVMLFRNISREKKLEEFKADFISSIAHDIKSLLVPMRAFIARILLEKYGHLDGPLRTHIAIMNDTTSKIFDIVENYLNISRIESGRLELSPAPVDLSALIAEMVRLYHPRLQFISHGSFPPVWIDKPYIDRVFVNLITNAMKFSPDDSPVIITVEERGPMAVVSVQDRGTGIPDSEIPYVFERYRGGSFSKKVGGTGLGLFIVKSFVRAHEGDVWVEHSSHEGTTFSFSLPFCPPET